MKQIWMRDQKNRPTITTYIKDTNVVKGESTALFLCLLLLAIFIYSF